MFICPVCQAPLYKNAHVYSCSQMHSFDLAKEGYLYLLPPNKKHSKDPGDTKEMVTARRAFLEQGGYAVFREELCRLAQKYAASSDAPVLLDVGCGEGYYTGALGNALPHARLAGIDIAKCAVRAAAKKYKEASFAVASCFSLPVADACVDLAVNVFAPLVISELHRVLRPGGTMLLAVPGPAHLYGLKQIAYERPYENEWKETAYDGFILEERTVVSGCLHLTQNQDIQNLFAMTPYYWKTDKAGSARVQAAKELSTPIEFHFLAYSKRT